MRAEKLMSREVKTIPPGAKVSEAIEIMRQGIFRHLPVVDGSTVIGMLSDRDIRLAGLNVALEVRDLCTTKVVYVSPDTEVNEILDVMLRFKIGAMPVLDKSNKLVGIVTETDLLKTFAEYLKKV